MSDNTVTIMKCPKCGSGEIYVKSKLANDNMNSSMDEFVYYCKDCNFAWTIRNYLKKNAGK